MDYVAGEMMIKEAVRFLVFVLLMIPTLPIIVVVIISDMIGFDKIKSATEKYAEKALLISKSVAKRKAK